MGAVGRTKEVPRRISRPPILVIVAEAIAELTEGEINRQETIVSLVMIHVVEMIIEATRVSSEENLAPPFSAYYFF